MDMRKITLFLFVLAINLQFVYAQTSIKLFPEKLNIQPFTAHLLEPKLGCQFDVNSNELRLNIGNSLDLVSFSNSPSNNFSIGADFFTFTLLRSQNDFHFPVDAVDYLFGVNAGYKQLTESGEYGIRVRLSHISAHLVDGHYDKINQVWKNGQTPRVYSREFFEFLPFYSFDNLRVYGGLTYIYHIDPADLGKTIYQAGFDYFPAAASIGNFHPFVGYDLKLTDISKYRANNSIMAGIKFGYAKGRGISLYYNYYNGNNFHGEYFDKPSEYSAFGFNLDL
ncbi:MAG: DUF1207 domain-containing protein [Bacteroidota bacterium]|nr:DUF1207 domain-containing protein [Bacteroidota bacterium]MDP4193923.1 DUF1207 domain-containing protein [Bacteroidota bacterium]